MYYGNRKCPCRINLQKGKFHIFYPKLYTQLSVGGSTNRRNEIILKSMIIATLALADQNLKLKFNLPHCLHRHAKGLANKA